MGSSGFVFKAGGGEAREKAVGGRGRGTGEFRAFLAQDGVAHQGATQVAQRLGGEAPAAAFYQRTTAPRVVAAEGEAGEDQGDCPTPLPLQPMP